jgi:hypothetical protein
MPNPFIENFFEKVKEKITTKSIIASISVALLVYSMYNIFNYFDFYFISGIRRNASIEAINVYNALQDNQVFRQYLSLFIIKNFLILLPVVIAIIRKHLSYLASYSISLVVAINVVKFYNLPKDIDLFMPMVIIGNLGLFRLFGSRVFTNLLVIPSLCAVVLTLKGARPVDVELMMLTLSVAIFAFTFCFKVQKMISDAQKKDTPPF